MTVYRPLSILELRNAIPRDDSTQKHDSEAPQRDSARRFRTKTRFWSSEPRFHATLPAENNRVAPGTPGGTPREPQGRPWQPSGPIFGSFLASFGVSICKNCVLSGCHFGFNFGVSLKCIFCDSRTIHGVGDLKRTSELGSRERTPCVRKRNGPSSRPISGRPARQRFTQRDHTRP